MFEETSPLDAFLFEIIGNQKGKILDYGCGQGRFIDYCRVRGLAIYGADTFQGIYESWSAHSDSILKIENNVVPAKNHSFEVVISNQVLEHIPYKAVSDVSRELTRLLSSTGYGLHIFPTRKTLIEPHVGIFGAHWFKSGSTLQKIYLYICFKLGFGYWRSNEKRGRFSTKSADEWVHESLTALKNHCFYISNRHWSREIQHKGFRVENVGYLLLLFAMPKSLKSPLQLLARPKFVKRFLNTLVSMRLGVILRIMN